MLVGKKRQHSPFAPLEANPDFRDLPDRRFSGSEDDPLSADGLITQAAEHTGRKREVGSPGVHQDRLTLGRSAVGRKHFDIDVKESHGSSQTM